MGKRKPPEGIVMCRELIVQYGRAVEAPKYVSNSMALAGLVADLIEDQSRETLVAIYVSAKNRVLGWRLGGVGGVTSCIVDASPMLQGAILAGAAGMLLGHNHPSGSTTPSPEDIQLTRQVAQACDSIGMRLLDHVVIAHNEGYTSIRDAGLFPSIKDYSNE